MRNKLAVRTALVVAVGSAGLVSVPHALASVSDNCEDSAICQSGNRQDRSVYSHGRNGTGSTGQTVTRSVTVQGTGSPTMVECPDGLNLLNLGSTNPGGGPLNLITGPGGIQVLLAVGLVVELDLECL